MNQHSHISPQAYNQIVESLAVTFIKVRHIKILQPWTIENFHDVENFLILLHSGQITCWQEDKKLTVAAGDILFIPGGQSITITYGSDNSVTPDNNATHKPRQYLQAMPIPAFAAQFENFSYITFDARVFNTANFFTYCGVPSFVIKSTTPLCDTFKKALIESSSEAVGSSRMLKVYTEKLVIEIVRHLADKNIFTDKLAAHIHHFDNPRISSIFDYIQKNLPGDLSNRVLATVANVAEDYAGQFFKIHTGSNPQNYIEYQRMEQAVKLLRTTQKSISDVGRAVGFKDTAYFCRRFKMRFGISAGKLRSGEIAMGK